MSVTWRNTSPQSTDIATAMQAAFKLLVGSASHYTDSIATVTAADAASTLATVLTLCENIYYVYLAHLADGGSMSGIAHKAADAAPALTIPTDQTTANTFLNAVKSDFNTHIASTTYHPNADGTNVVTASNATDLASSITLANDIKAQLNAHIASAGSTAMPRFVSA